ncbi:MAG: hypothetical protein KAV87_64985, partial [Desulfobacteraceae bacterium]|nr:hypothetical protein [Desulfobacteraceae bacterium]
RRRKAPRPSSHSAVAELSQSGVFLSPPPYRRLAVYNSKATLFLPLEGTGKNNTIHIFTPLRK